MKNNTSQMNIPIIVPLHRQLIVPPAKHHDYTFQGPTHMILPYIACAWGFKKALNTPRSPHQWVIHPTLPIPPNRPSGLGDPATDCAGRPALPSLELPGLSSPNSEAGGGCKTARRSGMRDGGGPEKMPQLIGVFLLHVAPSVRGQAAGNPCTSLQPGHPDRKV